MSISTTRGRPRPDVTPPVDRVTMVFYSWSGKFFASILYSFNSISGFPLAENGGMSISAATPEMTSPFNSLNCCRLAAGTSCLALTIQKVFDFFDYH
jgi:hypothetical protein